MDKTYTIKLKQNDKNTNSPILKSHSEKEIKNIKEK